MNTIVSNAIVHHVPSALDIAIAALRYYADGHHIQPDIMGTHIEQGIQAKRALARIASTTVQPSIPAAGDFQIWKERNAKYIEPKDFWQWLEQAFNDGKSVSAPAAIDVRDAAIPDVTSVLNSIEVALEELDRNGALPFSLEEHLEAIRALQSPPQTGKEA